MSDLAHKSDVAVKIYFRRGGSEDTGYISAYTMFPKEDGEDWNRGNDLADGPYKKETLDRIIRDLGTVFDQHKPA